MGLIIVLCPAKVASEARDLPESTDLEAVLALVLGAHSSF